MSERELEDLDAEMKGLNSRTDDVFRKVAKMYAHTEEIAEVMLRALMIGVIRNFQDQMQKIIDLLKIIEQQKVSDESLPKGVQGGK